MELGMIGLGRMGANMVRRVRRAGQRAVVFDRSREAVAALVAEGVRGASSLEEFTARLEPPRTAWLMVPAAAVDATIDALAPHLATGDVIVDGGNSHFADDVRRAARLREQGIRYVDCGVSGGVWGLERGYCLMLGGEEEVIEALHPILEALSPGVAAAPELADRGASTAERGYLRCGPHGAGHFVKMVHNAIEYGMMAAYAEGFNLLAHADAGERERAVDAETTPLREPELYRYAFDLPAIAELWRRGSVISSWLLDLSARALAKDPRLAQFSGSVSDSGEGRWTLAAANDLGVPVHVLSAALFERFTSRGEGEFQNRLLSALRFEFGGHAEKST